MSSKYPNIGIIGDTHEPFCKKGYLEFCRDTFKRYGCSYFIHAGDIIDAHAMSYHEHCPEGMSPDDEAKEAIKNVKRWYKAFPKMKVCIGNHDALPWRQATTAGIPKRFMRFYEEVWEAPKGWQWGMRWEKNGVLFTHGTGNSGPDAHMRQALRNRQPTVIGHVHAHAGVRFHASEKDLIWGMNVGCGIDRNAYAFEYGKFFLDKPVVSCGLVLENGRVPLVIPMKL